MIYKKSIFDIILKVSLFIVMIGILMVAGFIIKFYAYADLTYYKKILLIVAYGFFIFLTNFISKNLDKIRNIASEEWFEDRKRIDKIWIIRLLIFFLLIILLNYLNGILKDYLELQLPLNQIIVENEIKNSPVKTWFYFHIVLVAPILEELIFRKIFMNLFFKKNNFVNHTLSITFSGLIFAFLHETSLSLFLIFYASPGILLAFVYRYFRDIRLPICIHILNNCIFLLINLAI